MWNYTSISDICFLSHVTMVTVTILMQGKKAWQYYLYLAYNFKAYKKKNYTFIIKKNGDEMNIYFVYLIIIQPCACALVFKKCTNCLFELQRPFFQNDAFPDFIFCWGVHQATELCEAYIRRLHATFPFMTGRFLTLPFRACCATWWINHIVWWHRMTFMPSLAMNGNNRFFCNFWISISCTSNRRMYW